MYAIDQVNFKDKSVLIRVDFNVPLNDDLVVSDDTRIRAAIPTVHKVLKDGGKVILMSHLGRPKNLEDKYSLKHLVSTVSELLGADVMFVDECVGENSVAQTAAMDFGKVALLENVRYHAEEEAGDEFFAGQLAEHGDVYINDAFGTAHRKHASTAVIARFFPNDKYFGYLMEDEVSSIEKVLYGSQSPVTAIIGGAKVSSKIDVLRNLIDRVDHILIGGGMAYTFIKAMGGHTGSSMVEEDRIQLALEIIEEAKSKGVVLHLPVDTVVADAFNNDANRKITSTMDIPDGWMGLDIGPKAIAEYKEVILNSKTVLWNGPMGVFEMENFRSGTLEVANALVEATKSGTFTLIGGGDSVAAINMFGLADDVSYVSTGGGAMLEFLEGKELPGITAIREA